MILATTLGVSHDNYAAQHGIAADSHAAALRLLLASR